MKNWLIKIWVRYFVQVDPKAKCPACGTRARHQVQFHPAYKKLLHNCGLCKAVWAEDPLVKHEHWSVEHVLEAAAPAEPVRSFGGVKR